MGETRHTAIPKFGSLEEERGYWEARGPLAEGHKGTVNRPKPRQKRSSFLAVRLTGEELTRMRDTAAQLGLGPSTFARLVLLSTLHDPERWRKLVASDQFRAALQSRPGVEVSIVHEEVTGGPYRANTKDDLDKSAGGTSKGNPNSPCILLMDAAQMKQAEELALPLLRALLAIAGVQLITPQDENYEKVRRAASA